MTVSPPNGFALIKPGQTYFGKWIHLWRGRIQGNGWRCMNVMQLLQLYRFRSCYALMYAATRTISKAAEKSAGTGKMKLHAIAPPARVASANAAIIGRTCAAFERAREASCHSSADCNSMATLRDQPNPMKKSR
jgi:hypothetical protein